jgi:hypothetical protein
MRERGPLYRFAALFVAWALFASVVLASFAGAGALTSGTIWGLLGGLVGLLALVEIGNEAFIHFRKRNKK